MAFIRYERNRRYLPIPETQRPTPRSSGDEVLDHIIFETSATGLQQGLPFTEAEVEQWSLDLANDRTPAGYYSMEDFRCALIQRLGRTYQRRRNRLEPSTNEDRDPTM